MKKTKTDNSNVVKGVMERIEDIMASEPSEADLLFARARNIQLTKEEIEAFGKSAPHDGCGLKITPFVTIKEVVDRKGRQKHALFLGIKGIF